MTTTHSYALMNAEEINERNEQRGLTIHLTADEVTAAVVEAIDETVDLIYQLREVPAENEADEAMLVGKEYDALDEKVRCCFRDRQEFLRLIQNALDTDSRA